MPNSPPKGSTMEPFAERRQAERRQGPIRSGQERRRGDVPVPAGVIRSEQDRRQSDRRCGIDRRAGASGHAAD